MDTDNSVVEARGGARAERRVKWGKMGTSATVSIIKIKKKKLTFHS